MTKALLLILFSTFLAFPMLAQENPKIEVFGGYQFLRAGNFDGLGDSASTNGWNAAGTFNFRKHLGIAADFGGGYRSEDLFSSGLSGHADVHIYTYTFGPVVSLNAGKNIRLFAHSLFGGAHVRPTACVIFSGSPDECGSGSASGFAMMLGGGVDASANKVMWFRLVQFDWVYLPSEFGSQSNNFRVSTGIVLRF